MLEKGIACESGFPLSNQAGKERVEKQTRIKEGYFVLNQTLMGNSPASERPCEACVSTLRSTAMSGNGQVMSSHYLVLRE